MDERLVDLEVKVTFLEKLYSELDQVVRQLSADTETLRHEVARWRALAEAREQQSQLLPNEKPPHY